MTQAYVRQFDTFTSGAEAGPDWLRPVRLGAIDRFADVGFPDSRDEDWRFTPVSAIAQAEFSPAPVRHGVSKLDLTSFEFGQPEWPLLVFIDGHFDGTLSRVPEESGITVGSIAAALAAGDPEVVRHLGHHARVSDSAFTALNTAFMRDGAYARVAPGVSAPYPIQLLFVTSGADEAVVTHPRNLLIAEAGSRVSVIESYVTLASARRYFTNTVTEVVVAASACIEHVRIQRESDQAYHVGLTHVEQSRDSHYRSFTLAMGGAIARHNLDAHLNEAHVETLLYGLYLTRGAQVVDNHTAIHHDQPNCNSWEVYKGVLTDRSRAVFNGKVFVRAEAQKTDAKQTNRNLLLSDGARVDTKPQLEIFADDVKCTHGATVGRLDAVALFYLRSRGLSEPAARRLLTYAFAAEVLEEVQLAPVRSALEQLVRDRLSEHG